MYWEPSWPFRKRGANELGGSAGVFVHKIPTDCSPWPGRSMAQAFPINQSQSQCWCSASRPAQHGRVANRGFCTRVPISSFSPSRTPQIMPTNFRLALHHLSFPIVHPPAPCLNTTPDPITAHGSRRSEWWLQTHSGKLDKS